MAGSVPYFHGSDGDGKNASNIQSIEKIKAGIFHIERSKIAVRERDCNEQILKLADVLKKKKHAALVFVDPFGMQINWNSIASLKNTRSDIWILIPSGVAINRLLPRSGQIKNKKKLETFFGMTIEEVRSIFYKEETKETLFGEMDFTEKLEKPIERISELYQKQMRTVLGTCYPEATCIEEYKEQDNISFSICFE